MENRTQRAATARPESLGRRRLTQGARLLTGIRLRRGRHRSAPALAGTSRELLKLQRAISRIVLNRGNALSFLGRRLRGSLEQTGTEQARSEHAEQKPTRPR